MGRYYDNYPPGFNGKFPWDDDVCFLDYDNAFESTLQWLEENPNEFKTDPKKLFLAMGGTLRTQDDWEDFSYLKSDIQKAIKTFDNKNTINECNNMKKKTIRLTESELKKIITESVKKILKEEFDRVSQTIQLPCYPSTVEIMEYIRDNGMPSNELWEFSFKNGESLLCSEEHPNNLATVLEAYPLEEWHDVLGMKRIKISDYLCYINNKFYRIS